MRLAVVPHSMPSGESPQHARDYYTYLQGHQETLHVPKTWEVDWLSLAWLWGFVIVLSLAVIWWIWQNRTTRQRTGIYPIDRSDQPPYHTGTVIGTPVTALRIGGLLYLSMPGEPFPEVRATIARDTAGADEVVALSKGQDDLAYFYPSWAYPVTLAWGSDHWEYNVAPQAGDQIVQGQLQNAAALGFDTGTGIVTPGANDYGQMVKPGLQLLASPASGDAGRDGTFTTSLQAIYSPAHTGGSPLAGSKVHWDLGDGTTADTAATKDPGAPGPTYFDHAYAPGTYVVRATGADTAGHPVSAQMTVRVFPRLVPTIGARPGRRGAISYTGDATGGNGSVLAWHWSFSDGGSAEGRQVSHTFAAGTTPRATLTVTDGTGSTASTTTTDRRTGGGTKGPAPCLA